MTSQITQTINHQNHQDNQDDKERQDVPDSQALINQQILSSLHDIHEQSRAIAEQISEQNADFIARIDRLEKTVTKKATIAGAAAGAVAGAATSGIFTVGMEFVKAKFGG